MPPVTVTSLAVKVVEGFVSVKLIVAVSPALRADLFDAIAMPGTTVSITSGGARLPAVFGLFTESKNIFSATVTVPGTVELANGVKVAVYEVPEPVKPERAPPVTTTSSTVKLVDGLLSANETTAVSPALSVVRLAAMAIVGITVSMTIAGDRTPARLGLPAASVKVPAAIVTVPVPVVFAGGVKIAVYVVPDPVKSLSVPPVTTTSAAVNVVDGSLRVNVSVAVRSDRSTGRLVAIATEGTAVSMASAGETAPAELGLPAASVNAPAATPIVPLPVKAAAGVKRAE